MVHVLFVCVHNSCRSQMAEGFAQHLGGNSVVAFSAGSSPSGRVNERAIAFMREKEIDIAGHRSKGLDELPAWQWDYIVTMGCGDACPSVPARHRVDWDLADPTDMDDNGFRAIRDEIERLVRRLLDGTASR